VGFVFFFGVGGGGGGGGGGGELGEMTYNILVDLVG